MSSKQRDSHQWMNRNICVKCWWGMMKSSIFNGLSSIHIPPSSIFYSKCFFLYPLTSNLLDPTLFLHLQLFFPHPQSKERDIYLKSPQNSGISEEMSASTATIATSFFQLWPILTLEVGMGGRGLSTFHFRGYETLSLIKKIPNPKLLKIE